MPEFEVFAQNLGTENELFLKQYGYHSAKQVGTYDNSDDEFQSSQVVINLFRPGPVGANPLQVPDKASVGILKTHSPGESLFAQFVVGDQTP
jgi:hypothetical protein